MTTDDRNTGSMLELMAVMGSSLATVSEDLETSVRAVLGMIGNSMPIAHVVLLRTTPAGFSPSTSLGLTDAPSSLLSRGTSGGIVQEVRRTGSPVFSRDIDRDTRFGEKDLLVSGTPVRSVACLPIGKDGENLGAIYVASEAGSPPLGETEIKLLGGITGLLADFLVRAKRYDEMQKQAVIDPLTGLMNRRQMEVVLATEAERCTRYAFPLSLVMMDLDHFKQVNDTHGHGTGDAVLKAFAGLLIQGTRRVDHLFRYGGEEFLSVLPHIPKENAKIYAERIRRTTGETLHATAGLDVPQTVSLGIACMPADGDTIEAVLEAADRALYAAKQGGRDRVVLST
jgi:diguanylate cyclase (GGDEF)-like protein